jgi:O-antigen ligase
MARIDAPCPPELPYRAPAGSMTPSRLQEAVPAAPAPRPHARAAAVWGVAARVGADPVRWALLTILVVVPLYPKVGLVGVSGTYIPVRIDDVLIAALVALWVGTLVRDRRRPAIPPVARRALAWIACGLVSLLVGALALRSISGSRGLLYFGKSLEYLMLAWIAYDAAQRSDIRRPALIAVALASALVILYGVLQGFGAAPAAPTYTPYAVWGRVTSTMADPHELATYLGIVGLLAVGCWSALGPRGRALTALGLFAGAFVLAGTGTRSEVLTAAALLLVALSRRSTRVAAIVALAALALALVLPTLTGPPGPAAPAGTGAAAGTTIGRLQTSPSADPSLRIRFDQRWPKLLHAAARDPVLGLGPSAAGEAADGYYVRAYVETGVVGLAAFLVFVAAVLAALWRVSGDRVDRLTAGLGLGLAAATVFVAVVGLLIDTWVASRPMETFWPLVGIALAAAVPVSQAGRGQRASRAAPAESAV